MLRKNNSGKFAKENLYLFSVIYLLVFSLNCTLSLEVRSLFSCGLFINLAICTKLDLIRKGLLCCNVLCSIVEPDMLIFFTDKHVSNHEMLIMLAHGENIYDCLEKICFLKLFLLTAY